MASFSPSLPPADCWHAYHPESVIIPSILAAAEAPKKPLGEGGSSGGGRPGGEENQLAKGVQQFVPLLGMLMLAGALTGMNRENAQEVSFQWFKTHLLAKGAVEKVEVANKQTVKVSIGT